MPKVLTESKIIANTAVPYIASHIAGTGADHSYINQDVTTSGTPTFASLTLNGDLQMNSNYILAVGAPTLSSHVATKGYVDTQLVVVENSFTWKNPVRAATTVAGTLATDFENTDVIDGVTLATGDRILIKNQVDQTENGIYTVAVSGPPSRTDDYATGTNVSGTGIIVVEGSTNGDGFFICTSTAGSDEVGTDNLTFAQTGGTTYSAGDGIDLTGTTFSADVSDFAGTGLEDDGSNNLRIAATAAGDGLQGGGGSALAVDVSDFAGTGLEDDGSENLRIAATAAGAGLIGGGGSALAVGAGDGITVNANDVAVNVSDFAGTNLEDDGSNNLRIAATAAGAGLTGGGASALAVGAGDGITVNANDVAVNVSDIAGTNLEDDGSNNLRIAATAAGAGLTGGGASVLAVGAGDGITVNANDVAVNVSDFAGTNLEDDGSNNLRIVSDPSFTGGLTLGGALDMGSNLINNVTTPSASTDAATKGYVDTEVDGISWKQPVRAASTANGTLATDFENGDTLDGVTLVTGNRILLKNQSTGSENGIYIVAASGAPARASDFDTGASVAGAAVIVNEGSTNADSFFFCSSNSGSDVVGTDALTFSELSGGGATYTGGDGIDVTGTVISAVVADFAGTGLEDDGSNNLRIAAAAAGAGLTGGAGSALAVGAGDGITVNANDVQVTVSDFAGTGLEDDASNNLRIAAAAAGAGLTGGGGSALAVGAGDGITVNANDVQVNVSDFAGTNLEDDGSNNLRIAATAAGGGLTGGGASVLAVGAGDGITVNANDVAVNVSDFAGTNLEDDGSNNLRIVSDPSFTGGLTLGGALDMGSNLINNVTSPSAGTDAANRNFVEGLTNGVTWKNSVRVATAAAGTLATSFENGDTVDGVVLATSDRILIKDQSTASENGIYIVAASGAPSRAADLAAASSAAGIVVVAEEGTANADRAFICTSNSGSDVVGTNNLTFEYFNLVAGDGIDITSGAIIADVSDFAGTGLEDDGSNNLRIAAAAAGAGLTGGAGSALAVGAGDGITVNADDVAVNVSDFAGTNLEDDGSNNLRIAATAAGAGLTGGGASALAVGAGDGITVNADDVAVNVSDFAGTGLEDDLSNNLRIAAAAAGAGLTGGGGSALAVGAGDGITVNANDVQVTVSDFAGTGLEDDLSNNLRIAAAAAGAGLTGGGGSALAVGAGDGITVNANDVQVTVSAIAGTGLEDDGSNNLRIAAAAAGDGLQGGGGSALAVDVSAFAGTGLEDDGSENLRIATSAAGNGLTGGGGSALAVNLTTDTYYVTTYSELSSAVTAINSSGNPSRILAAPGTYSFTAGLDISTKNVVIEGSGMDATTFQLSGTATYLFEYNTSTAPDSNIHIKNLTMDVNDELNKYAVDMFGTTGAQDCSFTSVRFLGINYSASPGGYVSDSTSERITYLNCIFEATNTGTRFMTISGDDVSFIGCMFIGPGTSGIGTFGLVSCDRPLFSNCRFLTCGQFISISNVNSFKVTGCIFETCPGTACFVFDNNGGDDEAYIISDNIFFSPAGFVIDYNALTPRFTLSILGNHVYNGFFLSLINNISRGGTRAQLLIQGNTARASSVLIIGSGITLPVIITNNAFGEDSTVTINSSTNNIVIRDNFLLETTTGTSVTLSKVTSHALVVSGATDTTLTVPDLSVGSVGHKVYIELDTDGGGDCVITPTSFINGDTLLLTNAGDYAILEWTGLAWIIKEYSPNGFPQFSSITTTAGTNVTTVTVLNGALTEIGGIAKFDVVFQLAVTSADTDSDFTLTVPKKASNFNNTYEGMVTCNGWFNNTTPDAIGNVVGHSVASSKNIKFRFTTSDTNAHYISASIRYSLG